MKRLAFATVVVRYCLVRLAIRLKLLRQLPVPDFNNTYDDTIL